MLVFLLEFQADVETDEVYAQMTLQPLTPVVVMLESFKILLISIAFYYIIVNSVGM